MSEEKLNLVRTIIGSSNFKAQDENHQRTILEQIIATGEVSRDDVMKIYNNQIGNNNTSLSEISYLERLPYNVFLNIIVEGKITGKDLIDLCNSSSKINQQCNKPLKLENSDQVVPQYLFMVLLQKIGVNYQEIHQKKPNLSPRDLYFYYTVGDGASYTRLRDKMNYISENYNEDWSDIKDLYELLYEGDSEKSAFLRYIAKIDGSIELGKFNFVIREIYYAQNIFDEELTIDINEAAKLAGMTVEELLHHSYRRNVNREGRDVVFDKYFPGVEYNFKNYMKIIRNYPEYFGEYLLHIPNISDHYYLFKEIKDIANSINQHMEGDPKLDRSKLLNDQDIEYLIRLHLRVLSGELTIATKFRIEDLI